MKHRYCLAALAALLGGCFDSGGGGGSGDDGSGRSADAICQVVGNGSYVSAAGIDDPVLGFDGHLDSWATLGPAASANGTLTGGNLSRPAGDVVGMAYTAPEAGTVRLTITTYLGNVAQDSGDGGTVTYTTTGNSMVCPSRQCVVRSNGLSFGGIEATKPYDRIEAVISITNLDAPLQIRELCVR